MKRRPDAEDESISCCDTVCGAAEALSADGRVASIVRRPLTDKADAFARYVASRPQWPDTHELHPLEATHDRVAILELSHESDCLDDAVGYGRDLPARHSPSVASADNAIAQVLHVLPDELAAAAALDAAELLMALRRHTGRRQFALRLELVLGDTCQKWHRDLNVARSIVTYVGPGTLFAREYGVTREADGTVVAVDAPHAAMQADPGDFLLMKGGLWHGAEHKGGAAHRAPTIGPVHTCTTHRLMLKVDCMEDF